MGVWTFIVCLRKKKRVSTSFMLNRGLIAAYMFRVSGFRGALDLEFGGLRVW